MKNRFLKTLTSLVLAILMVATLLPAMFVGTFAAEPVTLSFAGGSGTNVDPITFTDETSGVSAVFTAGTHTTSKPRWDSNCVRFYGTANMTNDLTVSAPAGSKITQIDFTMNGSYGLTKVTPDSGTIDGTTWTGSAEKVVFTTTAQTRIEGVTVTYTASTAGGGEGGDTETPSCEHTNKTETPAVDADCTTPGHIAYSTCNDCGVFFDANGAEIPEEDTVVPAPGHNYVDGVCSECGVELPLEYTFDYSTGTNGTEAANVTEGAVTLTFSKGTNANNAPKFYTSGNAVRFYVNNTLTISTIEGYYISNITLTLTQEAFVVDSGTIVDGVWTPANKTTANVVFTNTDSSTQARVSGIVVTLAKVCPHTNTTAIGTPADATCTEDGITAGVKCAACGEVITAQETIPALGHKDENPVDSKCDVCEDNLCTEHAWVDGDVITEGDCTTDRVVAQVCDNCGEPGEDKTITAPGHTEVIDASVTATCVTPGLTAGSHCSVCEEVIVAQTVVDALGHTYENGVCIRCESDEPKSLTYELVDLADIKSTDKIIIVATTSDGNSYAMSNDNGASDAPDAVAVTIENEKITTNATNILWNIANDNGNLTIYQNGTTESWLYCNKTNNGVRVGDNTANVFTLDTTGYLKHTGTSRYLGVYNNQDWRCYENTTGNTKDQTFTFYKQVVTADAKGWSISLKGDIGVNFFYDKAWFDANEGAVVTATVEGSEPVSYTVADMTANGSYYVATLAVTPDQMDTEITWTVTLNGEEQSTKTVRVRKYINSVVKGKTADDLGWTDEKFALLTDLLTAMDAYGTAVENYKGTATVEKDHENALNNVVVTPDNSDAEGALTINAVSGTLDSTNGLNFHFTAAEGYTFDDYTLTVTFRGHTVVDNKKLSYFAEDNADATGIDMSIDGMIASDLDEKVTVSIALATDATVVSTISCSFMDYVCLQYNLAENANNYKLLNLLNAIANYSAAAEAYFGK